MSEENKIEIDSKKPWQSKTFYVSVLVALAPLIPQFNELIKSDPALVTQLVAAVFAVLRLLTHGKISLK